MTKKQELKKLLNLRLSCTLQHTGWPCGTCFFSISKKLTNRDWQTVLFLRGDYKKADLTNLPKDIDAYFPILLKKLTNH